MVVPFTPFAPNGVKWKTMRDPSNTCGCVPRVRWDTLALLRGEGVGTIAGFEAVCPAHTDPVNPVPVGMIQDFQGDWLPLDVWEAWEGCWFNWIVYHEIDRKHADQPLAERDRLRAKETAKSRARADRVPNVPNLHRVDSDDGPWKPRDHVVAVPDEHAQGMRTVYGWLKAEDRLQERMKVEVAAELGFEPEPVGVWWEGQHGTRMLHVALDGRGTTPQRTRAQDAIALQFGAGRLIWED